MFLRHRLIRPEDLETCLSFTRDRHLYAASEKDDLLRFWRELITGDNCSHSLFEETQPGGRKRIVYFCITVPIHDAFIEETYAGRQPPSLSHEVFRAWQAGKSPLRTIPEIAAANRENGTRMFVLHSIYPEDLDPLTELLPVLDKVILWIPRRHSGYRYSELIIESYSDLQVAWSDSAGLTLRIDYATAGWTVPNGYRDCVYGLSGQEAKERPATPYTPLFTFLPPRFFFVEGERLLLLHALSDETDADIAHLLCVSPETIKKRWASIVAKVERTAPELLPEISDDPTRKRGPEKRRHILAYVEHHMEELRPYAADQ